MGCLNDQDFGYWFANIHLSGPCNRSCYFCIGQHMMALDPFNNLDTFPLDGWDEFVDESRVRGVDRVYLTGSNTDPLLHSRLPDIVGAIRRHIAPSVVGIRTNAAMPIPEGLFDHISVSVTSFDADLYRLTMGQGAPPRAVLPSSKQLSANVVLCPETVRTGDILRTLAVLRDRGFQRVNLREPYGQPHIGDPLAWMRPVSLAHGNPSYDFHGLPVTYWNVHYTEVSSVNLYASGRVSTEYSVTKGHAESGTVLDQSQFRRHGRHRAQWTTEERLSDV